VTKNVLLSIDKIMGNAHKNFLHSVVIQGKSAKNCHFLILFDVSVLTLQKVNQRKKNTLKYNSLRRHFDSGAKSSRDILD
jgi:hypothetical protein